MAKFQAEAAVEMVGPSAAVERVVTRVTQEGIVPASPAQPVVEGRAPEPLDPAIGVALGVARVDSGGQVRRNPAAASRYVAMSAPAPPTRMSAPRLPSR